MKSDFVFTSESVTEGHPDKLCDVISDAIVDQFLQHDPYSRILAECAVANGVIFIAARFYSKAAVDLPQVARQIIKQTGYTGEDFNDQDCTRFQRSRFQRSNSRVQHGQDCRSHHRKEQDLRQANK